MYTNRNFTSKTAIKKALAAGEKITVYQPGPFGDGNVRDGHVTLEGPHYPESHRWYATGIVKDGFLVSIK